MEGTESEHWVVHMWSTGPGRSASSCAASGNAHMIPKGMKHHTNFNGVVCVPNNPKSPKNKPRLVLRLLYGLVAGEAEGTFAIAVMAALALVVLVGAMRGLW